MPLIGLTGSIGAGKSTIASLLTQRGYLVLDADAIARELTTEAATIADIQRVFPQAVSEGVLDRAKLAALAFSSSESTQQLNDLLHPKIQQRLREQTQAAVHEWIVHDIPLLYESNRAAEYDAVIVVDAPQELRIARVMARSGLSREDILNRESRQMPAHEKRARTPFVLENNSDLYALEQQLDDILEQIKKTPFTRKDA